MPAAWALCAIVLCLSLPLAAQAGTITSVLSISGPGLGKAYVPAIISSSEGNDNQPGGPGFDVNLVVITKRFDHPGYIDLQFAVRGSDPSGTTEYQIFESVDNNIGFDWDSYTTVLGFGVGAGFTQSGAGDGLDFDAPGYDPAPPSSSAFSGVALGEDVLGFSGGIHSSGSEVYEFRIDVPDGIQSFTLRQYPHLVPEPSTLVLACGMLVGAALVFRRRRPR